MDRPPAFVYGGELSTIRPKGQVRVADTSSARMKKDTDATRNLPCLLVPKRHNDGRGWFSEIFHEKRLQGLGIANRFVQDNQASSKCRGTLRGLHFQLPPAAQAKLVTVVRGRILDIAVDVRRGSPTFGKHVSAELSAEEGRQFYIPIGFAHGYLTLEDEVMLMYKVSDYYAPALDGGIYWRDPDIAFPWPIKQADLIVSDKDDRLPALKDFDSPFDYNGDPLGPLMASQYLIDGRNCYHEDYGHRWRRFYWFSAS